MKPDEKIPERDTYIIEFIKNNTKFICNRNSDMYDRIFNDKYVKFWEVDEISALSTYACDNWYIVQILEGIDNFNKRHQKYINEIKKQYIKDAIDADEKLSNLQFTESVKAYRKFYKEQYYDFIHKLINIEHLYDKLYDMSKKLFYKDNIDYLKTTTYWNIWNDERMTYEQRILVIMLRNYICNRKINGNKYPYPKGYVKRTINEIIKIFKY